MKLHVKKCFAVCMAATLFNSGLAYQSPSVIQAQRTAKEPVTPTLEATTDTNIFETNKNCLP